jgi:hypothetical protein
MKVTYLKAIVAKCWECSGFYEDGRVDCGVRKCPLYEFMPYRQLESDLEWTKYNHKGVGQKEKKPLTEEQLVVLRERMRLMRENMKGE